MGSNVHAILPLPECKAQKLKISDRVYAYDLALLRVHLELQFSLKIFPAGFEQPFRRSLAPCQNNDVVCMNLFSNNLLSI